MPKSEFSSDEMDFDEIDKLLELPKPNERPKGGAPAPVVAGRRNPSSDDLGTAYLSDDPAPPADPGDDWDWEELGGDQPASPTAAESPSQGLHPKKRHPSRSVVGPLPRSIINSSDSDGDQD
jgi:hypothetical protein